MMAREFKAQVTCPLDFSRMPFDTQVCPINLESFWHTKHDLKLNLLGDDPIYLEPTAKLNGWSVSKTRAGFQPKALPASLAAQGLGTYHSIGEQPQMAIFELELSRDSRY